MACDFGKSPTGSNYTTYTVLLSPGESINNVTVFFDTTRTILYYYIISGIGFSTTLGNVYGVYGPALGNPRSFIGKDLLYFHGRWGTYVDAIGVVFGKC